jgi:putative oxidoreductase
LSTQRAALPDDSEVKGVKAMMSWILLLGRLLFGGFFFLSGINHLTQAGTYVGYVAGHGVPSPGAAVIGTGILLLLGGSSVLLGVAPRVGLALLVLFLVPVTFVMHAFWNIPDVQARMFEMGNFMKNMALTGAALGWMAVPVPWPFALDALIRRRWPSWTRWTGFDRPAHQT